jgi:Fe-S oxidoreductase
MSLQIIMMFQWGLTLLNWRNWGTKLFFVDHEESGRAYISKGFLEEAKAIANTNLFPIISQEVALIGIEPSAILTFRDEYIRLADDTASAEKLAKLLDNRIFQNYG